MFPCIKGHLVRACLDTIQMTLAFRTLCPVIICSAKFAKFLPLFNVLCSFPVRWHVQWSPGPHLSRSVNWVQQSPPSQSHNSLLKYASQIVLPDNIIHVVKEVFFLKKVIYLICNFLKNLFYSVLSIFTQVLFSNDNRFNNTSSIYADPSF